MLPFSVVFTDKTLLMPLTSILTKNCAMFVILSLSTMPLLSGSPIIMDPPGSRNVTISTDHIVMTCKARAEFVHYTINNESAAYDKVVSLGFHQDIVASVAPGVLERNLTIIVSEMISNSRIACVSYNINSDAIVYNISKEAVLQVQGRLTKPDNLEVKNDHRSFNLKWRAPPTLNGTVIDGYNVSVNGSHYVFTENTEASISFDGNNSPCTPLEVEVSAFNGIDGDSAKPLNKLYFPSKPVKRLTVNGTIDDQYSANISVKLTVDVSNLCPGEKPHTIETNISAYNDSRNDDDLHEKFELVPDHEGQTLRSNKTISLNATKQYEIQNTLSNSVGIFDDTIPVLYICRNNNGLTARAKVSNDPCYDTDPIQNSTNSFPSSGNHVSSDMVLMMVVGAILLLLNLSF